MNPDRFFSPNPITRKLARELYEPIATLPIVSPHGHVDPRLFSDPNVTFGSPADLFIIPDHYVTRMLYSQGIWLAHELSEVFGRDEKPSAANADRLCDHLAAKLASPETL